MATRERLYRHRWGQALVEKEVLAAGARVLKDYGKCGFPGTLICGRLLPKREYRALRSPAIIDFASCTATRHFPKWLRQALEKRDRLGLLKLWHRYAPETVPPVLTDYFNRYYHKNLATPTRLYRETRRCLDPRGLYGECGRVRRVWIAISVAVSIAATIGLVIR